MKTMFIASLFFISFGALAQSHVETQQGDPTLKPEKITLPGSAQKIVLNSHKKTSHYELQKGNPNLKAEKLPVSN
jgi:hypothetical protein